MPFVTVPAFVDPDVAAPEPVSVTEPMVSLWTSPLVV